MMSEPSHISAKILPEHSDNYGHLNNSFYAYYFEKARDALQKANHISDDSLKERGLGFWVQDTYINRKKQLMGGDDVSIGSTFVGYIGIRAYMHHIMKHDGKEVSSAISEHFLVKLGEDPTPLELPDELVKVMEMIEPRSPHLPGVLSVVEFIKQRDIQARIDALKKSKA